MTWNTWEAPCGTLKVSADIVRRKLGDGIVRRLPRRVYDVVKHRHRRDQLWMRQEWDQGFFVLRSFNEHEVGLPVLESAHEAPGRPRAVVANAKDSDS